MFGGLIDTVIGLLGFGPEISLGISLLAIALYWKKFKKGAGLISNIVAYIVVVCVALGIMIILGIADLNLSQAISVAETALRLISELASLM